jgi:hypothetical protein
VTYRAAVDAVRRHRLIAGGAVFVAGAVVAAIVLLASGGGPRSTLPPSPGPAGAIALRYLAHDPEVYSYATITTVGTVARVPGSRPALYALEGGHGARIVLEPSYSAARELGRRVRVRGIFSVSFKLGYEILVSQLAPAPAA